MDEETKKILDEYHTIHKYCSATTREHEFEITQWPFLGCKHCKKEFLVLTKEMADAFFEIKFFKERLSS